MFQPLPQDKKPMNKPIVHVHVKCCSGQGRAGNIYILFLISLL